MPVSKARRERLKLRRAAESEACALQTEGLRADGASCGSCRHMSKAPFGMGGKVCDLGSEGPWYQPVMPNYLCHQWEGR